MRSVARKLFAMTANTKAAPAISVSAILDLLRLATPIAASRLALPLMSITDTIVLGKMAPLEIAFITTGYLLFSVGFSIGTGILQGVQVITAELSGVGRGHDSGRVFRRGLLTGSVWGLGFGLIAILIAGPLFGRLGFEDETRAGMTSASQILLYGLVGQMIATAAGTYLEALRKPNLVVVVMYGCVLANLILDLALVAGIWGFPPMGADGVAWASTVVRFIQAAVLIVFVGLFTPGFVKSSPTPDGEFGRQTTVGMGGAFSMLAEYTAFNLTFVIATQASLTDGSVYSIALQPTFFCFMLFLGIGVATSIRVAEHFARGDFEGVRDASRLGVASFGLIALLLSGLIYLGRAELSAMMINIKAEPEMVAILTVVVGISALVITFDGLQAVVSQALRAQEVVWASTAIQILAFVVVMLPAAWWFAIVKGQGAAGVMWGVVLGSFVAGSAQYAMLEWKTARRMSMRAVSK